VEGRKKREYVTIFILKQAEMIADEMDKYAKSNIAFGLLR
jgi:hypothetical protein